jgi:hypothetical protein
MTERELNQLACRLAEPLWEQGFEARWVWDTGDAFRVTSVGFEVWRQKLGTRFHVTEAFLTQLAQPERAPEIFRRHVERAFRLAVEEATAA